MKWVVGLLGLVSLGIAWIYVSQTFFTNPSVTEEMLLDPLGPKAQRVTLITLPDGRTLPINYLREGDQVFLGADGPWWRQFKDGSKPVSVWIQGETLVGTARAVTDDPDYTADVFTRLRPAVPGWLPDWANGVLVVVDLQPAG